MTSDPEIFIDEFGNIHEKDVELGRGGQGVVFRTRDPDIAIKVVLDGNGRAIQSGPLARRLRAVRLLPVPPNLQLSMPAAILRDRAGYAMRLLSDMVPFKHFWPGGSDVMENGISDVPAWLVSAPESVAGELIHYVKTGGLRRRLLALYRCSAILGRIHAAGLVYGDISPANVYISRDLRSRSVWMIDADNLRFETKGKGPGVFTPGFGAPELMQGLDGGRPRTDCYAFAVMAFWLLTLQHPFLGDYVESASVDWADDDADQTDLTEKAYSGMLPWIDDDADDTNATAKGLPRNLVLTSELKAIFQETFGPGRTSPWRRPVIFHWPYLLARALDSTISCPACEMSYYDDSQNSQQRCPFCKAGRPALLRAYARIGNARAPYASMWNWSRELPENNEAIGIPHRLLHCFSIKDGDCDILEIEVRDTGILLRRSDSTGSLDASLAVAVEGNDEFVELATSVVLPKQANRRGFRIRVEGSNRRDVVFSIEETVL